MNRSNRTFIFHEDKFNPQIVTTIDKMTTKGRISTRSNGKVSDAESLEIKFMNAIEKTRELKSEVFRKMSDYEKKFDFQEIERQSLEVNLKEEREKFEKMSKENGELKSTLRQWHENVEALKIELNSKDNQMKELEKDNQKLRREKDSFKERVKAFINDISEGNDFEQQLDEPFGIHSNNKRTNDPLLIDDDNPSGKRRKTIDDQDETNSTTTTNNRIDEQARVEDHQSNLDIPPVNADRTNVVRDGPSSTVVEVAPPKRIENPIQEKRRNFRKNIKKILNFEDLTPETKRAYQQEKERKKQYTQRLQKYNETYGALPGEVNGSDKLVLDFDLNTKRELLAVDKRLSIKLKQHQCQGVKFMWDACFESLKKLQSSDGGGCILGHCMGLGKTLQVIVLVHTLVRNFVKTKVEKVLIICPVNVIVNWVDEFEMWLKDFPKNEIVPVYELFSCVPTDRVKRIKLWHKKGGVLIIGYRMFQNMEQKSSTGDIFYKAFIDPGPHLVVCDEGHLLKNPSSQLSLAVCKIRTLRRIILTGTPLQNNLKEYYSMIEFVKPRLLGTEKEFNNRFVSPIVNGQFVDSTDEDITLMKYRAYILHKLLDGCVQRRDYSVLAEFLPPKQEYVLFIRLTKLQVDLYKFYMTNCVKGNPVADMPSLRKICNHPKVLADFAERRKPQLIAKTGNIVHEFPNQDSDSNLSLSSDDELDENTHENIDWWKPTFDCNKFELTGKMSILFSILSECELRQEKLLVFSGCLSTLNVIESFLASIQQRIAKSIWTRDMDYLRLDGSDNIDKRRRDIARFNDEKNKRARLFLISTRAGGLGINLMAANRVVIFDASWNPSDDIQSIFRTYRISQKKECFVYRFIALGTMEEKIYDRQVSKLSIAKRVIDEHQISRHFKEEDLQQLYSVENLDPPSTPKLKTYALTKDDLLTTLLKIHRYQIFKYHDHDSLFANMLDETLTDEEVGDVWEEFEMTF